jgi:hypothetical protein
MMYSCYFVIDFIDGTACSVMWMQSMAFQSNNITLVLFGSRELRRKLGSKRKGSSGKVEKMRCTTLMEALRSASKCNTIPEKQHNLLNNKMLDIFIHMTISISLWLL